MGHCGSGKTSIYNKICGTNYLTKVSKFSNTTEPTIDDTLFGNSFTIIDTPGDNSKKDVKMNALMLKHSVSFFPLNAIFIVVKFHDRVESMIE
jgi:GTPase Era involved in 16S rRNA processing